MLVEGLNELVSEFKVRLEEESCHCLMTQEDEHAEWFNLFVVGISRSIEVDDWCENIN